MIPIVFTFPENFEPKLLVSLNVASSCSHPPMEESVPHHPGPGTVSIPISGMNLRWVQMTPTSNLVPNLNVQYTISLQ